MPPAASCPLRAPEHPLGLQPGTRWDTRCTPRLPVPTPDGMRGANVSLIPIHLVSIPSPGSCSKADRAASSGLCSAAPGSEPSLTTGSQCTRPSFTLNSLVPAAAAPSVPETGAVPGWWHWGRRGPGTAVADANRDAARCVAASPCTASHWDLGILHLQCGMWGLTLLCHRQTHSPCPGQSSWCSEGAKRLFKGCFGTDLLLPSLVERHRARSRLGHQPRPPAFPGGCGGSDAGVAGPRPSERIPPWGEAHVPAQQQDTGIQFSQV